MYYLSADIGGTSARVGLVKYQQDKPVLVRHCSYPNAMRYQDGVKKLINELNAIKAGVDKIGGLGVGLPGVLDTDKKKLVKAENIPDWEHKPIWQDLSSAFAMPVSLENDAVTATLGEYRQLSPGERKDFLYVIWGTGIGGARLEELEKGIHITHSEIGSQILVFNGKQCTCGQRGCLVAYAGGYFFEQNYNMKPTDFTDSVWNELCAMMAHGIVNAVAMFGTGRIIIGGGVICKNPFLLEKIRETVREHLHIFPMPAIHISKAKELTGLCGAPELFRVNILS